MIWSNRLNMAYVECICMLAKLLDESAFDT